MLVACLRRSTSGIAVSADYPRETLEPAREILRDGPRHLGVIRTECAERGLRLAIEGASVRDGPRPAWLKKAVDLNFSGLEKGSTILDIEAPTLGDALGSDFQQRDFWTPVPAPTDTALSLLSKSIHEATSGNLESEYYDAGVLNSLLELKPFFKAGPRSVELIGCGRERENVMLGLAEIEKAEQLKRRTPDPRAFVVSGHLDAIQHSRRRFDLILADGQRIPGRVDEEFLTTEVLRNYWGRAVTIKGTVHFKPSGRVQLLEAQALHPRDTGDEVFDQMPAAEEATELFDPASWRAGEPNPFNEVRGTWPGEESIEELLVALRQG